MNHDIEKALDNLEKKGTGYSTLYEYYEQSKDG